MKATNMLTGMFVAHESPYTPPWGGVARSANYSMLTKQLPQYPEIAHGMY